jgi:hypothetical protein
MSLLGAMSAIYALALTAGDRRFFVQWASTNLANLPTRPFSTMVVSAFVTQEPFVIWAVVTTLGLVTLVHRFGNRRAALLVSATHVLATLVSEGVAAIRLFSHDAPTAIKHIVDVGPSYVTTAALVAVAAYGRRTWERIAALTGFLALAPFLFEGLTGLDISAVGHATSAALGLLIGMIFLRLERRGTPVIRSGHHANVAALARHPAGGSHAVRGAHSAR